MVKKKKKTGLKLRKVDPNMRFKDNMCYFEN